MQRELLAIATGYAAALLAHELGHLIVARLCAVRVLRVTLGFGPQIFAWTDNRGTRWKMAMLPLGGSCTFHDCPRSCDEPIDAVGCISRRPLFQRACIFFSGPAINLVLGIIIIAVSLGTNSEFRFTDFSVIPADPWLLIGGFSIALGLFNLLPILPMDGGHLLIFALEGVRRRRLSAQAEAEFAAKGAFFFGLSGLAIVLWVLWLS